MSKRKVLKMGHEDGPQRSGKNGIASRVGLKMKVLMKVPILGLQRFHMGTVNVHLPPKLLIMDGIGGRDHGKPRTNGPHTIPSSG